MTPEEIVSQERERIVAWLRKEATARAKERDRLKNKSSPMANEIFARVCMLRRSADAIERGDHLRAAQGEG